MESGSPRILQMMNKGYTPSQLLDFWMCIKSIYERELSTDIIAGFPTETYEDINLTIDLITKLQPKNIRIHTYQNSPFIPASKYKQLSKMQKDEHYEIYKRELKNITHIL